MPTHTTPLTDVSAWVDYIQTLHAREIELSLDRVTQVYQRLFPKGCPFSVISVAGTNGKGSTTELIASIYRQADYRTGKFTSPHLIRFNERFNVNGSDVNDQVLLSAFATVESARADTPITFFEYGFLLALVIFAQQEVEIAILEVGLGGRLDAVNALDADVAIITSIAMDHSDWLGDTLEKIAFEKAGIARPDRPCIVGVREPQRSMQSHLDEIGAIDMVLGRDFAGKHDSPQSWKYLDSDVEIQNLSLPFGQRGVQLENACLAIRAIQCLQTQHPVSHESIRGGLKNASISGRCQIVNKSPLVIIDVAHNEASAKQLAKFIKRQKFSGRLLAVCGMLRDKEIGPSLSHLLPLVDEWHFTTIDSSRGSKASDLQLTLTSLVAKKNAWPIESNQAQKTSCVAQTYESAVDAYQSAVKTLTAHDCLLVFGSFFVAGDILALLEKA